MNMDFNELFSQLDCDIVVNDTFIDFEKTDSDKLSKRLLAYHSALSKLSEKQQDKIFTIIDELTDFELDKNKDSSNNDSSEQIKEQD